MFGDELPYGKNYTKRINFNALWYSFIHQTCKQLFSVSLKCKRVFHARNKRIIVTIGTAKCRDIVKLY